MLAFCKKFQTLTDNATPDNLGDVLVEAVRLIRTGPPAGLIISDPFALVFCITNSMNKLYSMAARVDIGWKLFANTELPSSVLTDKQALQILVMARGALREAGFSLANLREQNAVYGAITINFFINSLCSNVTSWFLLGAGENKEDGFAKPGSIIRVLQPLGLSHFLDPVYKTLDKSIGSMTFGEVILKVRNKSLVHTDFLPDKISMLFTDANLHLYENKLAMSELWHELGDELLILELKLTAILNASDKDLKQITENYIRDNLGPEFLPNFQ